MGLFSMVGQPLGAFKVKPRAFAASPQDPIRSRTTGVVLSSLKKAVDICTLIYQAGRSATFYIALLSAPPSRPFHSMFIAVTLLMPTFGTRLVGTMCIGCAGPNYLGCKS